MDNRLRAIERLGQAIWLDNLSRALIEDGELRRLVDEDGLSGVTSNPTIFEKAMAGSNRYDDAFAHALGRGLDAREIFFELAFADIRDAADILHPVFARTEGQDGYVSFELPPELAYDTEGSIETAVRYRDEIGRPNVLIKVPGTPEGVQAFEELTAAGVSINVTLLFAVSRHEQIMDAYLRGLERRVTGGEPVDRIASVASFFVSRVDAKVDGALLERGREELKGRAAIANAKLAYQAFRERFSGERWEHLRGHAANLQRPLWASTSVKNPDHADTLYVDGLIGPDTVNTMPDATLAAAREHAEAQRSVDRDVAEARELMQAVREAGVDVDDIVERQLVDEGVQAFADSFDSLIDSITDKARSLRADVVR